jgi:hypothetical protein
MASAGKLPVYMRIGDTPELEVGTVELDLIDGQVTPRLNLAALLRAAAEQIEKQQD